MPVQATIAITPGAGQLLDAVSLTIGPNTVVRETMVLADPSNATHLATITAGGALLIDGSATTQPVSGTITANQGGAPWSVSQSGTWNITTLTSITNPVAVTGTFWQATQPVSLATLPSLVAGAALIGQVEVSDGTNLLFASAHPGYVQFGSAQHVIVDSGGGGGTQYVDGTAESAGVFTGTVAMSYNGTDVVGLRSDGSDNLYVNLNTALPAGTNVIGHVIVDSGSITVSGSVSVSGSVTATQGTAAALSGYWPVGLSDGTNLIGVSAHPAYVQGTVTAEIVGHAGVVLDAVLGATKPANVLQVGGNDGTNAYSIPLTSGGAAVEVAVSGNVSTVPGLPTTGSTVRTNGTTSSSGWTSIISAGGGSTTVRLWRLVVSASAATNIEIGDGSTVFLGPYYLTANGSIALDISGEPWCVTGANGSLQINNSNAVAITYTTWTTQS